MEGMNGQNKMRITLRERKSKQATKLKRRIWPRLKRKEEGVKRLKMERR